MTYFKICIRHTQIVPFGREALGTRLKQWLKLRVLIIIFIVAPVHGMSSLFKILSRSKTASFIRGSPYLSIPEMGAFKVVVGIHICIKR